MSSDYRPRGGSESGGGGRGPRRRRGGRGRGPQGSSSHGEHRAHSNGHSAPKKKEGPLAKLIGWITGKNKKKPETHSVRPATTSRPDFKEREPRPERTERRDRPPREERAVKVDPTPQEVTTEKLYVGNLAYEAAESDLFDLFSTVGKVKNVEVAMDRRSGRSKGFGFVEMEALDSAKAAAEKLNRTDFMGRQIVVSGAKLDKRPVQSSREEETPTPETEGGSSSESTI
jgi:hypothetical protein